MTAFSLSSAGARKVFLALFLSEGWRVQTLPAETDCNDRRDRWLSMVRAFVPLVQVTPGHWHCKVPLAPGRHEYLFLVDGEWVFDPDARELCRDGDVEQNCVRIVERVAPPAMVASNPRVEVTPQKNRPAPRRVAA